MILQTILIFLTAVKKRNDAHKQVPQIDFAQVYAYQFSFKTEILYHALGFHKIRAE